MLPSPSWARAEGSQKAAKPTTRTLARACVARSLILMTSTHGFLMKQKGFGRRAQGNNLETRQIWALVRILGANWFPNKTIAKTSRQRQACYRACKTMFSKCRHIFLLDPVRVTSYNSPQNRGSYAGHLTSCSNRDVARAQRGRVTTRYRMIRSREPLQKHRIIALQQGKTLSTQL